MDANCIEMIECSSQFHDLGLAGVARAALFARVPAFGDTCVIGYTKESLEASFLWIDTCILGEWAYLLLVVASYRYPNEMRIVGYFAS